MAVMLKLPHSRCILSDRWQIPSQQLVPPVMGFHQQCRRGGAGNRSKKRPLDRRLQQADRDDGPPASLAACPGWPADTAPQPPAGDAGLGRLLLKVEFCCRFAADAAKRNLTLNFWV
jgi:hypothetical protein